MKTTATIECMPSLENSGRMPQVWTIRGTKKAAIATIEREYVDHSIRTKYEKVNKTTYRVSVWILTE